MVPVPFPDGSSEHPCGRCTQVGELLRPVTELQGRYAEEYQGTQERDGLLELVHSFPGTGPVGRQDA